MNVDHMTVLGSVVARCVERTIQLFLTGDRNTLYSSLPRRGAMGYGTLKIGETTGSEGCWFHCVTA